MATLDQAQQAVVDRVFAIAEKVATPAQLLQFAEALAWVTNPNQPHGGGSNG